jgi:hypothetical protein
MPLTTRREDLRVRAALRLSLYVEVSTDDIELIAREVEAVRWIS